MALRLMLLFGFVALVVWAVDWTMLRIETMQGPGQSTVMIGLITLLLLVYAGLMATPFVPGIEIGLSLMVLRGADIAPLVYLATVLGLAIAFTVGRYLPYSAIRRLFVDLRLNRACDLIDRLQPLSTEQRRSLLQSLLPEKLGFLFVRGRYVMLAVLLNIPGNGLLGGGGGICLIAGLSRLFSGRGALIAIMVAVAPVPFMVWLNLGQALQ